MKQEETIEKSENKTTNENSLSESQSTLPYSPNEFEKFGKAFLNLVYKKDTNKVREYLLDTLINHEKYNKINKDSFINWMYDSPFDTFLLSNIKDKLDIQYTTRTFDQNYFYPETRTDIDDAYHMYEIVLLNKSAYNSMATLTILGFFHTKKGFQLYRYSVLPFD